MSRARWREYRTLLGIAVGQEYQILGVEQWLAGRGDERDHPLLLIRHDVDQHPNSALRMAGIEDELGIQSSWYFRWRTAHAAVVDAIRDGGHTVGLHYETLTRLALERRVDTANIQSLVPDARQLLMRELAAFSDLYGSIRSACPHGDTRVPGVHNGILLRGEDPARYGIEWDANDAVGQRGVDVWLTDRSRAEGSWGDGLDPVDLLLDRRSPLLIVVHPNNWVSGPALWWDRLVPGGHRTGSDQPAVAAGANSQAIPAPDRM